MPREILSFEDEKAEIYEAGSKQWEKQHRVPGEDNKKVENLFTEASLSFVSSNKKDYFRRKFAEKMGFDKNSTWEEMLENLRAEK